jgi:hypothetical protein
MGVIDIMLHKATKVDKKKKAQSKNDITGA